MSSSEKSKLHDIEVQVESEGEDQGISKVLPNYGKPWFQVPHLRKLAWAVFVISLASCNDGYDGSLFNSLYSEAEFNNAIGNVAGAVLGALTNGYSFGCLLAFVPTPYLTDYLGRLPAMYFGNSIMIVGVIIQSCAGVWHHTYPESYAGRDVLGMLIGARILLGMGTGVMSVAGPTLISELAYPTHREVSATYYTTSWYLGAIVSSWVCYGCRNVAHNFNWKIPTIVQGFFPLLQLILLPFFVTESPRFYVSKGRIEEARQLLFKWHAGGMESAQDLVDYELAEIQIAIEQERAVKATASYLDFFKTGPNRKRLWIIFAVATFMQLSGNGLVSYYLAMVLDSIGIRSSDEQLVVNGGLTIYNWVICVVEACFVIPRIKRKHAFMISLVGMLVTFIVWTILSAFNEKRNFEDTSLARGVLAMIFIYYLFYNLAFNGLPNTYITEIVPFMLRAKGVNILIFVQYVWICFNGFVNSVAMDAIEWRYYIVWCCVLVVESVLAALTFVETSGYTLEEVAKVFGDAPDLTVTTVRDSEKRDNSS